MRAEKRDEKRRIAKQRQRQPRPPAMVVLPLSAAAHRPLSLPWLRAIDPVTKEQTHARS